MNMSTYCILAELRNLLRRGASKLWWLEAVSSPNIGVSWDPTGYLNNALVTTNYRIRYISNIWFVFRKWCYSSACSYSSCLLRLLACFSIWVRMAPKPCLCSASVSYVSLFSCTSPCYLLFSIVSITRPLAWLSERTKIQPQNIVCLYIVYVHFFKDTFGQKVRSTVREKLL